MQEAFLTDEQVRFYHALRSAVKDWAVVCPKVNLIQLTAVAKPRRSGDIARLEQLAGLSIDFVLCDHQTLRPLLGVLLQHSPVQSEAAPNPDRRAYRGQLVAAALSTAGLPVVTIAARDAYNERVLRSYLARKAGLGDTETPQYAESMDKRWNETPAGAK